MRNTQAIRPEVVTGKNLAQEVAARGREPDSGECTPFKWQNSWRFTEP